LGGTQQVEVGALDQRGVGHAQRGQHIARDGLAFGFTLARLQHHFELEEVAQPLHAVEVDAGLAHHHQGALLDHASAQSAGPLEHVAQAVGVGHRRDEVVRALGAGDVGAVVVDELGGAVGEHAQLQASVWRHEEGVVLVDALGVIVVVGQRHGARQQDVDAVDAGLDFDVGRHGVQRYHLQPLPRAASRARGTTAARPAPA
jgi:hypothetical protein